MFRSRADINKSLGIKEDASWANLTGRELVQCFSDFRKRYKALRAEAPEIDDVHVRMLMIADTMIDGEKIHFYFVQRYPPIFYMITNRTVPNWYADDFMHFVMMTSVLVEEGAMTSDERMEAIGKKMDDLNPGRDEEWRKGDKVSLGAMTPTRFSEDPVLMDGLQALCEMRREERARKAAAASSAAAPSAAAASAAAAPAAAAPSAGAPSAAAASAAAAPAAAPTADSSNEAPSAAALAADSSNEAK